MSTIQEVDTGWLLRMMVLVGGVGRGTSMNASVLLMRRWFRARLSRRAFLWSLRPTPSANFFGDSN